MGPGHFGIGFAVKPTAPKAPLWVYLVASELLDILCFIFMAFGIEKGGASQTDFKNGLTAFGSGYIPWSHGLLMSVVWSLLFGSIVYLFIKDRRSSIFAGLVVFSHWVLDFIVHPPHLPLLLPGSPEVGLGLWTSGLGLIISIVLEVILLGGGMAIYFAWRKRSKTAVQTKT